MAAEDRRPTTTSELRPILDRLDSTNPDVRAAAVRALGRQESIRLLDFIAPALADPVPLVRARAAYAVEMASRHSGSAEAFDYLSRRLDVEPDAEVRGHLAHALGGLRYTSESAVRAASQYFVRLADTAGPTSLVLGVARGFEALFRPNGREIASSPEVVAALGALSRYRAASGDSQAAVIRRLAVSAVLRISAPNPTALQNWMMDTDFQVRRLSVIGAAALAEPQRRRLLERAFEDDHFSVRYAALGALTAGPQSGCDYLRPLDPNAHVRLLAIDALAECSWSLELLDSLAGTLTSGETWHIAAHALVALSRREPARAAARIDAFARHPLSYVRMYAARAASQLRGTNRLYDLGADPHHNVREVALRGLSQHVGHEADSVYIANLMASDYQLAMTAANLLEGTSHPRAAPALWGALGRITAERRETSRDVRIAILTRLGEVARRDTSRLAGYVSDFDSVVARRAAGLFEEWAGRPVDAAPQPLAPLSFPSAERLRELASTTVILHMEGGGTITIGLRPYSAPTNAHRFVRLAQEGYFDGLTFHRVVPNFVIQGGSPGANEYAGDGPYTRDEITGDPHLRGTIGLSTRGRDTGDGQIFINLVDNYRLDADYTIFGQVIEGMNVVDAVLEGAVILRAEVRELPR